MVWDGPGGPLLIDAGGNTYQRLLQVGIDPQRLRGIILTHTHMDHISGFFPLLSSSAIAGRKDDPLPVYCLEETFTFVHRIWETFETKFDIPLVWNTITAGDDIPLGDNWRVRTAPNIHSKPCFAMRFESPCGCDSLVYSGDTEPCDAVVQLAQGAATLIHEATRPHPEAAHTTPRQAGEIALRAGVARLVLVHFSPRWTMPEEQALEEMRASGFMGVAEVGQDSQVLELCNTNHS